MRTSAGKRIWILLLLVATTLFALSELSYVYAGENIEVTSKNFFDVKSFYGNFSFSPIVEVGIPASEHILIVKSCHCLDNAEDKSGNEYYFYMVDMHNGLKALITETKLDPFQEIDDKTKEFCEIVKIEIAKDGGIEKLINKFKN
jgi:hypothetical protein